MLMPRKKYGMSMVEVFSKNMEKLKKVWGIWLSFLFLLIIFALFFNLPARVFKICFVVHCILFVGTVVMLVINKNRLKDYLPETLVVLEDKLEARFREAAGMSILIVVSILLKLNKILTTMTFIAIISFIILWLFYIFYNIWIINKKIYKMKKDENVE